MVEVIRSVEVRCNVLRLQYTGRRAVATFAEAFIKARGGVFLRGTDTQEASGSMDTQEQTTLDLT